MAKPKTCSKCKEKIEPGVNAWLKGKRICRKCWNKRKCVEFTYHMFTPLGGQNE